MLLDDLGVILGLGDLVCLQAGDGSKRPVHFYREEITLSGLISSQITEDSPHTALQLCLCLELGVPRSPLGSFVETGSHIS